MAGGRGLRLLGRRGLRLLGHRGLRLLGEMGMLAVGVIGVEFVDVVVVRPFPIGAASGYLQGRLKAGILPTLELLVVHAAETRCASVPGAVEDLKFHLRAKIARAAELLQRPVLDDDTVLLCDVFVEIDVEHACGGVWGNCV